MELHRRLQKLAAHYGIGRKVAVKKTVRKSNGVEYTFATMTWQFTEDDRDRLMDIDAGLIRPEMPAQTDRRVEAYAKQLMNEGVSEPDARARARAAYGGPAAPPARPPSLSREMRHALLAQAATARRDDGEAA